MVWRLDRDDVVPRAAAALAEQLGEALRSLVVYGSAAGPDFDPERSDVNLAAVLEPLTFAHLERVAQWWSVWRRQRVAAPLLLSRRDLEHSRDVYPLETLDIQASHRTLAGTELFTNIAVTPEHVRAECEREATGKLLRLRALYLELAGSTRDVQTLMLDSRKTFLHVVRGLLYLRGERWLRDPGAAVAAFERHFAQPLPVLAGLGAAAREGPIAPRFAAYLAEVEALSALADREAAAAR
jgi:hypothetical protein